MLCAKAPRTLRGKDNCYASSSNCWGKIFHLSEADSQRFGSKTKVCLCLKHYEEKTPANSACCFLKRSDSDKCSSCLVICPQRLVTVFETISPPKTSSSKICHGHLKTADNDDRIIGNKYYSSARKVSSREDFIAWVIPVSFPSQLRAATCKYHLQLCKIEKSKILKLCHNKGFRSLITDILVSVHSRKYFSVAATFPSWTLQGQANRL